MSSYETVVEKVKDEVKNNFPGVNLKIVSPFYKERNYINLLSNKIKETINKIEYDHILFSYHGISSFPGNLRCNRVLECNRLIFPCETIFYHWKKQNQAVLH